MESLKNNSGSSGDELLGALQVRKRTRRRHRIKSSNLSARLNPNFDAKAFAQSSINTEANSQLNANTKTDNHEESPCLAAKNTLTSSLEKMSLVDRQEITASFKISMLNITLKFIKDPTQLTLTYPEMSLPKAQFLYNLIDPSKPKDGNLGSGFKSLYSSLFETMHNLKENFDFHLSVANTSNVATTKLILTKSLKNTQDDTRNKSNNDSSKNLNSSISSSTSSTSSKRSKKLSKAQKEVLSKEKIVNKLPENFLRSTLEKFFNFIEDKFMASLEFKDVNVDESRFLECLTWTSISSFTSPRSEEFCSLFSAECAVLLKRIRRALRRGDWTLRINVGKLNRTRTRMVTFYKTPCYGTKTETQNPAVDNSAKEPSRAVKFAEAFNITIKNSSASKDENDGPKNKMVTDIKTPIAQFDLKESRPDKSEIERLRPVRSEIREPRPARSENNEERPSESDSEKYKPTNKEDSKEKGDCTKPRRRLAAISFLGAGSLCMAEGGSLGAGDAPRPPASRTARLLQAFATPVEGGVAERIMRKSMGWEGGALGLRGEGIVEPIVPAIHLTPGAGLGHVKPQPQPNIISVVDFRFKLLNTLLSLLRSSATETAISFPHPVTKKHYRFFKPVLKSFNSRKKPGWDGPEINLVNEISQEMLKDPHFQIHFECTKNLKEFHLWKGPIKPVLMIKEKMKPIPDDVTDDNVISALDITNDIESLCPTRKAAEALAYKIKFLQKIKEFFVSEKETAEYKFDCVINKKRRYYIETIVLETNRGKLVKRYSDMENEILKDIWKVGKDWTVTIKFGTQSFKLDKKLLTLNKNTTTKIGTENNAPKSTDLKSTIIYINNKVIPAEKYIELNSRANKDEITANSKIIDDVANDVHDNDSNKTKTNCDKNISDSDFKALISDNPENNKIPNNDTILETGRDFESKFESSKETNDVATVGCEGNINVNDESVITSDDDNKFILPDTDESLNASYETDKDLESDLDSSKSGISRNMTTDEYISRNAEVKDDYFIKSLDEFSRFVNKDKLRSIADDKLTLPATEGSAANDTDKDFESDCGSSNANISLNADDNSITNMFKGQCEDNVSTKLSISDSDYDNFKSNLHSEVNNNHEDKDNNAQIEYLPNSSPKKRSSSLNDKRSPKKCKYVKFVAIKPKNGNDIGVESVKFIQRLILEVIDENVFLPLLKCHGIQDGELIYSCHNEDSYDWLKTVMNIVSDVEMTDLKRSVTMRKLSFKIASFIEEEPDTVLNRLQMYNPGLSTKKWKVFEKQQNDDFVNFHVKVDRNSLRYISENSFSLYVGIDKAQFSILWN